MGARRKRPRRGQRSILTANVVAWLVLTAGLGAFARAILQQRGPSHRRVAPTIRPPTPPDPRPVAAARPATPVPPRRQPPTPTRRPSPAATLPSPTVVAPTRSPTDLLERRSLPPLDASTRSVRLAVIIDDIGRDMNAARRLAALPYPLTFAILPHLSHSREAAELLAARGQEILLHLPMEPLRYPEEDPGEGAILSAMSPHQIRAVVEADLAAVPHVRGINNHMGSRITSEPASMRAVLEVLVGSPYFFIDSRTIDSSLAYRLARELRVPTAQRTVFLDAEPHPAAIRRELRRAVESARATGAAIAIGHPHDETITVLTTELARLYRRGVLFVHVSELVS